MNIRIATFNLNNLFSRWNFKGEIEDSKNDVFPKLKKEGKYWVRKYMGKLISAKKKEETDRLAERIIEMKPDILAVQEVEDKVVLAEFNKESLKDYFKQTILIEGNDDRFIDVGLMSTYPIGEVRSYQKWTHPAAPNECIFRRDLIQVEILSMSRKERLFWVFVTHLKSKYVGWDTDPAKKEAAIKNALKTRRMEAESIRDIISTRMPREDLFFLCGDFNDTKDSTALKPLLSKEKGLGLVNCIEEYVGKEELWTTSFKETGKERVYEQIDFILPTTKAKSKIKNMGIQRRGGGITAKDGSDHDPVFCDISM